MLTLPLKHTEFSNPMLTVQYHSDNVRPHCEYKIIVVDVFFPTAESLFNIHHSAGHCNKSLQKGSCYPLTLLLQSFLIFPRFNLLPNFIFERGSLRINALCACVYIYIRQLSSFRAPMLWFIDLTVVTCHIHWHFSEFVNFFMRKRMKGLPCSYDTKMSAEHKLGVQSIILRASNTTDMAILLFSFFSFSLSFFFPFVLTIILRGTVDLFFFTVNHWHTNVDQKPASHHLYVTIL